MWPLASKFSKIKLLSKGPSTALTSYCILYICLFCPPSSTYPPAIKPLSFNFKSWASLDSVLFIHPSWFLTFHFPDVYPGINFLTQDWLLVINTCIQVKGPRTYKHNIYKGMLCSHVIIYLYSKGRDFCIHVGHMHKNIFTCIYVYKQG